MGFVTDYLSADKQTAVVVSDDGKVVARFVVGETVGHQDTEAAEATIRSFEIDEADASIKVDTDRGWCRLQYLEKVR